MEMKPLILVVEDNPDILTYIKLVLEHEECRVITAINGKDGLKVLSESEEIPALIISDIMMPEMDGYAFFEALSENAKFLHVPFIFLSALDAPEDIRLGKMIGADDYLTKPINDDDLVAVVAGKIMRSKRNLILNEKLKLLFDSNILIDPSEAEKNQPVLIEVVWDDKAGPRAVKYHPRDVAIPFSVEEIGCQLYDAANTIYGRSSFEKAAGILINIENIKMTGYALFDALPDPSMRAGAQDYMLTVIAPRISYFQSLKIKEILIEISVLIKKKEEWKIETYWERISNELTRTLP